MESPLCLFCFKGGTAATPKTSSVQSKNNFYDISELVELLTFFKFSSHNSTFIPNEIHDEIPVDGTIPLILCSLCCELIQEIRQIQAQISQLWTAVEDRVQLLRRKITNSERKRRKNKDCQDEEEKVKEKLGPVRNLILGLGKRDDETLSTASDEVEVKNEPMDGFDEEEDLGSVFCDFIIDPEEGETFVKEETDELHDWEQDTGIPSSTLKRKTTTFARRSSRRKTEERFTNKGTEKKTSLLRMKSRTRARPPSKPSIRISRGTKLMFRNKPFLKRKSAIKTSSEDYDSPKEDSAGKEEEETDSHHSWSCNTCGQSFVTLDDRDTHSRQVHGIKYDIHSCPTCGNRFARESSLALHMVMKHEREEDKPFSCPESSCGNKRFTLEMNLKRHIELHKMEEKYPLFCHICDSRSADQISLDRHVATHKEKVYTCDFCQKEFKSLAGRKKHKRLHTGERPFNCDYCDEKFLDKARKDYHIAKFHVKQSFVCKTCGKESFTRESYKLHVARHRGESAVKCNICGEMCSSYFTLKKHKIEKHGDDPLICDECGAKFTSKRGFKLHKLTHSETRERPHKCQVCNAGFYIKETLQQHIKSHTNERPYVCDQCGKGFKMKHTLNSHIKAIHIVGYVTPTPYKCEQCGKAYPRRDTLQGHIRQCHTGEKPFVCQVCGKSFTLKTALSLHLKSHGIQNSKSNRDRLPRSARDAIPLSA